MFSRSNNSQQAIEHIQRAIALNPNRPEFYESLASVYVAKNNLEKTFELLEKAAELRKRLELEEGTNPHPYYYLGSAYALRFQKEKNEDDFKAAIRFLETAIAVDSKFGFAYYGLGVAYQNH